MKKYPFKDAKTIVDAVYAAATKGEYETRENFLSMLDENPHLAAQGYNPFGKIFFWNDASAHLYGHSESDAVNQDLVDLILPPDMRRLARDMIAGGRKTGKMPEPCPCDLVRHNGEFITVYSGHLIFQWDDASTPEFYCVDLPIHSDSDD